MIGIVAVYYYPDFAAGLDRIVRLLKRQFHAAGQTTRAIAVRNSSGARPDASCFDQVVVGANQHQEFGAYQEGLDLLLGQPSLSHVVFINDSAHGNHDHRRIIWQKFAHQVVSTVSETRPVLIGPTNSRQNSFIVRGAPMNRWVSTHFFAMNQAALAAVDHTVRDPEVDELIFPCHPESRFFSPLLHGSYTKMLSDWLFRPDSSPSWYRAEALSEQNAGKFAGKARSILQEHYLTSKLEWVSGSVIETRPAGVREKVLARYGPR